MVRITQDLDGGYSDAKVLGRVTFSLEFVAIRDLYEWDVRKIQDLRNIRGNKSMLEQIVQYRERRL